MHRSPLPTAKRRGGDLGEFSVWQIFVQISLNLQLTPLRTDELLPFLLFVALNRRAAAAPAVQTQRERFGVSEFSVLQIFVQIF